ncbi:MAG: glycosyltransferase family 4 protein [Proteobacteria bacterium]|nr:glycosyltransferase family 4 protein [Pseudomonadota bacterium]
MRLALVGPVPPPAGGMANQTRQMGELLTRAGVKVTMVPTTPPYRPAWVASWPGLRAVFRLVGYVGVLWRATARADVLHVMANSGWSWHLFAAPAIWVAAVRRVPVVVNYRGGEAAAFLARSHRLVRWSMRRAAALVVPSGFLQQVFGGHAIPALVVPNIVDLSRFRPQADGEAIALHVVVARNLEPIYDNASALRAFALLRKALPQASMTIAGSGPEAAMLERLAHSLGVADAVRFAGRLDRDEMAALYRSADVMLNPSQVDNMPNSLLEALASGVPIVSTDVGGVPFMVQNGKTALLVPAGDAAAMAAALQRVLAERGLRRQLVDAGLQEVQRYAWDQVAPLLAGVYRSAATGRK